MPDAKAGKPARKTAPAAKARAASTPPEAPAATVSPDAPIAIAPTPIATAQPLPRLGVRKTYKLFIGGAFPRSESGRSYSVYGKDGALLAHAAQGSRKDVRDAVVAARKAFAGWSGATAYNRGQILYRVAEMLEGRAAQFAAEVAAADGGRMAHAEAEVAAAIDRWVWYAGWSDKVAQVAGAANPVAGPYFNFSVPEPTGVVAIVAPAESSLLGLISVVAPVIVTGNTAVVVASESQPLPAISLAEVLATSDLPAGVVNVLTGRTAELAPVLAGHLDVNAIDLTGIGDPARPALEQLAASNVKRVTYGNEDWAATPGTQRLMSFLEIKTVWHPAGT
jgi:acyl-CoA reductase-like NAD-dependent aldehyde dehydrogenase